MAATYKGGSSSTLEASMTKWNGREIGRWGSLTAGTCLVTGLSCEPRAEQLKWLTRYRTGEQENVKSTTHLPEKAGLSGSPMQCLAKLSGSVKMRPVSRWCSLYQLFTHAACVWLCFHVKGLVTFLNSSFLWILMSWRLENEGFWETARKTKRWQSSFETSTILEFFQQLFLVNVYCFELGEIQKLPA